MSGLIHFAFKCGDTKGVLAKSFNHLVGMLQSSSSLRNATVSCSINLVNTCMQTCLTLPLSGWV